MGTHPQLPTHSYPTPTHGDPRRIHARLPLCSWLKGSHNRRRLCSVSGSLYTDCRVRSCRALAPFSHPSSQAKRYFAADEIAEMSALPEVCARA